MRDVSETGSAEPHTKGDFPMGKYTTYIGMDVHARSITAKGLNVETGELFSKRFGAGYTAGEIASWLLKREGPVYCAYESGCTGVWLARELRALGVDCDVIAVSTLKRSVKERQQKCDKRDAEVILDAIVNPASKHTVVWIPDETLEGDRELSRLYSKASDEAKHAKQELESFLLRHGHVWNEKTPTGRPRAPRGAAWQRWLDTIEFSDGTTNVVFEEMRRRERHARDEKARIGVFVKEEFPRKTVCFSSFHRWAIPRKNGDGTRAFSRWTSPPSLTHEGVTKPVGLAFEDEQVAMVGHAVDHRRRHLIIGEHRRPA